MDKWQRGVLWRFLVYIEVSNYSRNKPHLIVWKSTYNNTEQPVHYTVRFEEWQEIQNSFLIACNGIWSSPSAIYLDLEGFGSSWVPTEEFSSKYLLNCYALLCIRSVLGSGNSELIEGGLIASVRPPRSCDHFCPHHNISNIEVFSPQCFNISEEKSIIWGYSKYGRTWHTIAYKSAIPAWNMTMLFPCAPGECKNHNIW